METILVIEDEKDMVTGLTFNLEAAGYTVLVARDGEEGTRLALEQRPDLVILDLMLPKRNGYEVCRILKTDVPQLPVVMLTARSEEADIVLGLELGADDYVTKPFSVLELMARVKSVLRRTKSANDIPDRCCFGTLEIDFKRQNAWKGGKAIALSPREYEILKYFVGRLGEIVTREELLNAVWGYDAYPNTRTVDTHIAKLRQKVEEESDAPRHIITLHGIGYKFLG